MKIFITTIFFLFSSLSSFSSFAGGMTSSGGEFITTEKNPWFIGVADIRYCINKSENFSVKIDAARKIIKAAIKDWVR